MRRFLVALAVLLLAAPPADAAGFFQRTKGGVNSGGGGPASPNVLPGAGPITGFNTIAATNFGSSGDYGYNVRGWGRWDDVSLTEVGQSGVAGTRQFGLVFAHAPTTAELISGVASNICSVLVRIDKGSWFTIPSESSNSSAGGVVDWNFTVTSSNFSDGLHRVDAQGIPCTGPNIIMEGPLEDSNHYAPTARITAATIDNGSGSAGNILTVTGTVNTVNNYAGGMSLLVGWNVEGVGIAPNTFIDSVLSATTFHLTGSAQNIGSEVMTAGNEHSLYFITDYNNTLGRGTHITYVSTSGSDANSGLDAAHPKLNPSSAAAVITAQDPTNHGKYGGTVCLMDGNSWTSDVGTGSLPDTSSGFLIYKGANAAPCVHPGDAGNPSLLFNASYRTWGGLRVWYSNMVFNGSPSTLNYSLATQLVAEKVSAVGNMYTGGMLGVGGIACFESNMTFTYGQSCYAMLIRNQTTNYVSEHAIHQSEVVLNSTFNGVGPVFTWTSAHSTAGSKTITNVVMPAGYTIGQAFTPGHDCYTETISCIGVTDTSGVDCFIVSGTNVPSIVSINEAAHTILTDKVAATTCDGYLDFATDPGIHGDLVDIIVNTAASDIYFKGNNFLLYPGWSQGFFVEPDHISGIYLGYNKFSLATATPESPLFVVGGNDHVIYERNEYTGGGGYRQDSSFNSNDETFVGDKCFSGTGWTGAGTNIRRKAATSSACYVSAP